MSDRGSSNNTPPLSRGTARTTLLHERLSFSGHASMEDWAAALIAGIVQLLLALFLRHRPVSLVRCVRHAFTLRRSLKSRFVPRPTPQHARHHFISASASATHSTAQRHWDVLRLHVFEQGVSEQSQEAHYERRYQESHFGTRHLLSEDGAGSAVLSHQGAGRRPATLYYRLQRLAGAHMQK